jgi:hypothetical protein
MNKTVQDLPPNFKITHILPDGTKVDSIKGMVIPFLPETKTIYELIVKYEKRTACITTYQT